MQSKYQQNRRNNELARIHILAKELGLERDAYEDILFTVARVRSAAKLDQFARSRVLDHLTQLRGQNTSLRKNNAERKKSYPGRPHNCDENPQLKKIEALLTVNKLPWSYADGIAQRMFSKDRIAFCKPTELTAVITALVKEYGDDYA